MKLEDLLSDYLLIKTGKHYSAKEIERIIKLVRESSYLTDDTKENIVKHFKGKKEV